jgi:hypothetical protein
VVTCTVGALAAGASATRTVDALVTTAVTSDATLTTSVTVSGDQADPTPANNTASASLAVGPLGGTFQFSVSSVAVEDTAGTVTITVLNPSGRAGSVQVSTQDGTAKAGTNYVSLSTTLAFTAGQTSRSVTIQILPTDQAIPATASFSTVLGSPSPGSTVGSPSTETVTITHQAVTSPPSGTNPENKPDSPPKETEEQQQQRERTNKGNKDDVHVEGNVVEVHPDEQPPYVVIANKDGLVKVILLGDAAKAAGSIRVGDYLEADGEKQNEHLFEATDISVSRPR